MPQENMEALERALDAYNRGDIDALVQELDPEVEWHPAILARFAGDATVYRGHDGVRKLFQEIQEAFADRHFEITEIRDLGERGVAIGHWRMRGRESGAATESPLAFLIDVRDGKALRVRVYLDPPAALEAAQPKA
jgi:ketosteroid isomerase-like protein